MPDDTIPSIDDVDAPSPSIRYRIVSPDGKTTRFLNSDKPLTTDDIEDFTAKLFPAASAPQAATTPAPAMHHSNATPQQVQAMLQGNPIVHELTSSSPPSITPISRAHVASVKAHQFINNASAPLSQDELSSVPGGPQMIPGVVPSSVRPAMPQPQWNVPGAEQMYNAGATQIPNQIQPQQIPTTRPTQMQQHGAAMLAPKPPSIMPSLQGKPQSHAGVTDEDVQNWLGNVPKTLSNWAINEFNMVNPANINISRLKYSDPQAYDKLDQLGKLGIDTSKFVKSTAPLANFLTNTLTGHTPKEQAAEQALGVKNKWQTGQPEQEQLMQRQRDFVQGVTESAASMANDPNTIPILATMGLAGKAGAVGKIAKAAADVFFGGGMAINGVPALLQGVNEGDYKKVGQGVFESGMAALTAAHLPHTITDVFHPTTGATPFDTAYEAVSKSPMQLEREGQRVGIKPVFGPPLPSFDADLTKAAPGDELKSQAGDTYTVVGGDKTNVSVRDEATQKVTKIPRVQSETKALPPVEPPSSARALPAPESATPISVHGNESGETNALPIQSPNAPTRVEGQPVQVPADTGVGKGNAERTATPGEGKAETQEGSPPLTGVERQVAIKKAQQELAGLLLAQAKLHETTVDALLTPYMEHATNQVASKYGVSKDEIGVPGYNTARSAAANDNTSYYTDKITQPDLDELRTRVLGENSPTARAIKSGLVPGVTITTPDGTVLTVERVIGKETIVTDASGRRNIIDTSYAEKHSGTTYKGDSEPQSTPGEGKAQAQEVTDAPSLSKAFQTNFGLDKPQADAAAAVADARAQSWAKATGKNVSDWFKTRIAGVAKGGTPGEGALYQNPQVNTPEFKNWFGESHVVDDTGAPKVVYHGTNRDFNTFDKSLAGKATPFDPGLIGPAFYFTDSPEQAGQFAESAQFRDVNQGRAKEETGANIKPVYVSLKNPVRIEDGKLPDGRRLSTIYPRGIDAASGKALQASIKKAGYDGVILSVGGQDMQYVAFDPTQIKSATGNRGTFDTNSANILKQGQKGATEFLADGRAVIRALSNPDVSTAVHELAHVFRRDLEGGDLSHVETWAGVKDGKWDVPAEEKFARGFERYLRDGQAPTDTLKQVFAQFKEWLTNIYQKIKGSPVDVNLSPEVRDVFDRMLGKEEKPDRTARHAQMEADAQAAKAKAAAKLAEMQKPAKSVPEPTVPPATIPPTEVPKPTIRPVMPKTPEPTGNLGSESYIEAKKNPDGHYKLFYRGTTNEIFPGEKFRTPQEARQYFRAQKAKQAEGATPAEPQPTPSFKRDNAPQVAQKAEKPTKTEVPANVTETASRFDGDSGKSMMRAYYDKVSNPDGGAVIATADAIARLSGRPKPGIADLAEAMQYHSQGGLDAAIREVERSENTQPANLRSTALVDRIKAVQAEEASGATSKLQSAADAAKARVAARKSASEGFGTLQSGPNVFKGLEHWDLKDLAIVGANEIAKGARTVADFTKRMVAEVGDAVKPHIDALWQAALDHYHSFPENERVEPPTVATKSPEPPKPVEATVKPAPQIRPVQKPLMDAEPTAGIAQRVHDVREAKGEQPNMPRGTVDNTETVIDKGRSWAGDPEAHMAELEKNGAAATADDFGKMRAEQERLRKIESRAEDAYNADKTPANKAAFDAAAKAQFDWSTRIKAFQTKWAGAGIAQQGETGIDTGSFSSIRHKMEDMYGRQLTPQETSRFTDLTNQIADLQKRLDAANPSQAAAQATVDRIAKRTQVRTDLKTERDDILKQLKARLATPVVGAGPGAFAAEVAPLLGKLAVNLIKEGAVTLQDVVAGIRGHLGADGDKLSDTDIHDAISGYGRTPEATPPLSAIKQSMKDIKQDANLHSMLAAELDGRSTATAKTSMKGATPEQQAIIDQINAARKARFDGDTVRIDKQKAAAVAKQAAGLQAQVDSLSNQLKTGDYSEYQKAKEEAAAKRASYTRPPEVQKLMDEKAILNAKVKTAIANAAPADIVEQAGMIRKAGLLSSVRTLGKIAVSHASYLAAEEMSRIPASIADMTISAVTGKDRTVGGADVGAMYQSAKMAATRGAKEAWTLLKHGEGAVAEMNALNGDTSAYAQMNPGYEQGVREFNSGNALLNGYVNGIFRTHGAMYHMMKTYAVARGLMEQAKLGAATEAKTTPGIDVKKRAAELLANPSDTMIANAISAAEEATFINKNQFAEAANRAKAAGPVARFAVDTLAPFPKVPSNVVFRALDYSGAGLAYETGKIAVNAAKTKVLEGKKPATSVDQAKVDELLKKAEFTPEMQRRWSQTFGRTMTGAGIIGLGYYLASKGLATGSTEERGDYKKNDTEGIMRGSIMVGDKWRKIDQMAPVGNLMSLGAGLQELGQPNNKHGVGQALMNFIAESPLLSVGKTIGGTVDDVEKGKNLLTSYPVQSFASSYVPTIVGDMAAMFDPLQRKADNPGMAIQKKLPYFRNNLAPKVDAAGRGVPETEKLIDPFSSRTPGGNIPLSAEEAKKNADRQAELQAAKPPKALTPAQAAAALKGNYKIRPRKGSYLSP